MSWDWGGKEEKKQGKDQRAQQDWHQLGGRKERGERKRKGQRTQQDHTYLFVVSCCSSRNRKASHWSTQYSVLVLNSSSIFRNKIYNADDHPTTWVKWRSILMQQGPSCFGLVFQSVGVQRLCYNTGDHAWHLEIFIFTGPVSCSEVNSAEILVMGVSRKCFSSPQKESNLLLIKDKNKKKTL